MISTGSPDGGGTSKISTIFVSSPGLTGGRAYKRFDRKGTGSSSFRVADIIDPRLADVFTDDPEFPGGGSMVKRSVPFLSLGEKDLGMDCQWCAYLYEAYAQSDMWCGESQKDFMLMGSGERIG